MFLKSILKRKRYNNNNNIDLKIYTVQMIFTKNKIAHFFYKLK